MVLLKKLLIYGCLIVIASLFTTLMVFATQISNYSNSPGDLAVIQQYNKAMERCMENSLSGFSYDSSGRGTHQLENIQNSYARLLGKKSFFNSYGGNLIYSDEFEKNVSQGGYTGGIFGSGNDDGKMYCGENNDAVFHNAMRVFGIEENPENLKKLYCDENNSGIYIISKRRYENGRIVESDSNCGENFDLFAQYAEFGILDPVYAINVDVANNPVNHYQKWFKTNVGDFSTLSTRQQNALNYAKAVHDFQTLCAPSGPNAASFGSKSEVMVYDTFSGQVLPGGNPVFYIIGVDAEKKFYTEINDAKQKTCAEIATEISKEGAEAYAAIVSDTDSSALLGPQNSLENQPNCASSGAAGSLGWIICPVLNLLSNTSENIYNNYVEPALRVEPKLFSGQDDKDGTRFAWEIFRGVANTAFIILLIVVIFSQITGFGIDNYGIKKILPKLIIAAVLINLSYLICLICVDLSNIIGNGLQTLFNNLPVGDAASKIEIGNGEVEIPNNINAVKTTALTGVMLLIIFTTKIWGAVSSSGFLGGIVLPLLMIALTVVIAIFFLFLLLAARQAAIIVLTVVSPLAFACYILPNTKKVFDKWAKIGWGLLLVYPICGLLIGGGNYVSKLLLTVGIGAGGFTMAFMAMIAGVVPIFFIPSVLKSSLTAMGNLGAKISGIGDRLRGGTVRKIQSSEVYKSAQERGREQGTRIRAGIDSKGKERELSKFGRFIRGGVRGTARARAQYLKDQDTKNREQSLMGIGFMAAQVAQEKKVGADEIANEMILIKSQTNDGANEAEVQTIFDEAMMKGNWNKARAAMRLAGRRKDTATNFATKTLLNNEKKYSREALSQVAREISEGETAKNYRAGSPLAFEYALQLNQGIAKGADGINASTSYADWLANKDNIHSALDHHVTTSAELMGVQGSSLRSMADLITRGSMREYDVGYLRNLAQEAIRNNRESGAPFDITKVEHIYRLAYGDGDYKDRMTVDGVDNLIKTRASTSSGEKEGEIFSVRSEEKKD